MTNKNLDNINGWFSLNVYLKKTDAIEINLSLLDRALRVLFWCLYYEQKLAEVEDQ